MGDRLSPGDCSAPWSGAITEAADLGHLRSVSTQVAGR